MTQDKARKKAIRERASTTGESYTAAARALAQPQTHMFRPNRHTYLGDPAYRGWKGSQPTCTVRGCRQEAQHPAHWIGGTVPPIQWMGTAAPAMLSTFREGVDGPRVVQVLDSATGAVLASTSVSWRPAEDLVAEYEAAGLLARIGDRVRAGLGRPDLVAHRIGYEGRLEWQEWPDGSWRTSAWPMTRRHLVTAAPLGPHTRDLAAITVREYPGGQVVVNDIVDPVAPEDTRALNTALDRLGYTVATTGWVDLPGGIRYAAARPGHLAERDWWTLARVRIVRETTVGAVDPMVDRTFRVGEELTMNQRGRAGDEVLRDCWWSSTDIDGAHIIDADCSEVIEILEDIPPDLGRRRADRRADHPPPRPAPPRRGRGRRGVDRRRPARLPHPRRPGHPHPQPRVPEDWAGAPRLLERQPVHQAIRGGGRPGAQLAQPQARRPAPGSDLTLLSSQGRRRMSKSSSVRTEG
ncbi:hypothetical protein QTQ03_28545 [Micromonospora sp. WMMA1363]|uniref:hypothetical protein n=1 Tax=Micromonospora sp. WMMA1363 TaxID=3053985 RepID=UPI00259C9B7B|nr:hypothetical protein [Micromonospora sp. WMMA1363]MDM4723357.1 hypothetical protein [Micromonospora sp. WMMA1363]